MGSPSLPSPGAVPPRRRHSLLDRSFILITLLFLSNITIYFFPPSVIISSISSFISSLTCSSPSHPHHPHGPTHGAIATESSICTSIGADTLRKGGNAADAMIASMFCVGVVGMYHSGIGGGGFMLVRSPSGKYESIDFRESAPRDMNETTYVGNVRGSVLGGLASGVPGEVAGVAYLHERYGRLKWRELVMPAVRVAREGFEVTEDLVRYMAASMGDGAGNFLVDDKEWAVDFAPEGRLVEKGEWMTRKRYADTLERIANEGPDVFYTGEIARTMVEAVRKDNGTLTMEDLKDYRAISREPARISYRDYEVVSVAAPASGAVALAALKILEGYEDAGDPGSLNLTTHRLTEAFRFAYGQRTALGDPSYIPDLSTYQAAMLNSTLVSKIRDRISDDHTFPVSHYNPSGLESRPSHGTSHLVTADASGLAVSLTTTVNLLFGSKLMVPETGIIMNNEMNDFSIPGVSNEFHFAPSPNNYVRPGARPLSSCTPIIVNDREGKLVLVTGAAGGSRIITASTLQVFNVLDRGMTAAEALGEPRWHDQLVPDETGFEVWSDPGTVEFMRERGHKVKVPGRAGLSAAQSILLSEGRFEAASEPRQVNSGSSVV